MGRRRTPVTQENLMARKYIRYDEGMQRYGLGLSTFQEMAKEAKAIIKRDRIVLVDTEKFEAYLDSFSLY